MDINPEFIKAKILFKLARRRNWGASHTSFDNLKKGFKQHEYEHVKNTVNELIKISWILSKPTPYGLEVSLNPRCSKEIKDLLTEF